MKDSVFYITGTLDTTDTTYTLSQKGSAGALEVHGRENSFFTKVLKFFGQMKDYQEVSISSGEKKIKIYVRDNSLNYSIDTHQDFFKWVYGEMDSATMVLKIKRFFNDDGNIKNGKLEEYKKFISGISGMEDEKIVLLVKHTENENFRISILIEMIEKNREDVLIKIYDHTYIPIKDNDPVFNNLGITQAQVRSLREWIDNIAEFSDTVRDKMTSMIADLNTCVKCKGLYRVTGKESDITALYKDFCNKSPTKFEKTLSSNTNETVKSFVFKRLLKCKHRVFTKTELTGYKNIEKDDQGNFNIDKVREFINKIPKNRKLVIKELLVHINTVMENHEQNQMHFDNLCIVLFNNMNDPNVPPDKDWHLFIKCLLDNFNEIFPETEEVSGTPKKSDLIEKPEDIREDIQTTYEIKPFKLLNSLRHKNDDPREKNDVSLQFVECVMQNMSGKNFPKDEENIQYVMNVTLDLFMAGYTQEALQICEQIKTHDKKVNLEQTYQFFRALCEQKTREKQPCEETPVSFLKFLNYAGVDGKEVSRCLEEQQIGVETVCAAYKECLKEEGFTLEIASSASLQQLENLSDVANLKNLEQKKWDTYCDTNDYKKLLNTIQEKPDSLIPKYYLRMSPKQIRIELESVEFTMKDADMTSSLSFWSKGESPKKYFLSKYETIATKIDKGEYRVTTQGS